MDRHNGPAVNRQCIGGRRHTTRVADETRCPFSRSCRAKISGNAVRTMRCGSDSVGVASDSAGVQCGSDSVGGDD